MLCKYETIAEHDGVKFEIVENYARGLFGEPIIQACTFREVMRPTMTREVLGTYGTRQEARKRLEQELASKRPAQDVGPKDSSM